MKNLFIVVLILLFIGVVPVSCGLICDSAACECDDFGKIKDFDILKLGIKTTNYNNAIIDADQVHPFDEVYKIIFIEEKVDVASIYDKSHNSFFINSALACSPPEPKAIQEYSDVEIITRTNLSLSNENEEIQAGQDISDKFIAGYSYSNNFLPVEEFLESKYAIYNYEELKFGLASRPYKETEMLLDFIIHMSDGKVFKLENQILKVK